MLRYLPVLLSLALTVYCTVDVIQTPEAAVRNLPKLAWLVVVLLFAVVGPAAWLIAGRPRTGRRAIRRPPRPQGPDDDPEFLRGI